jgi:NTE family protein
MSEQREQTAVGLVLSGGGARGAYEIGVLSQLLPKLEELGQSPRVLSGTSVGALNAAFLAANAHLTADQAVLEAEKVWRELAFNDVAGRLVSLGSVCRVLEWAGQALGIKQVRMRSLLDSGPMKETIERRADFERIEQNISEGHVTSVSVVANSAYTHRSVVFHRGGPKPRFDAKRRIDYVQPRKLRSEHVRASAAIPFAFPAVHVGDPGSARGWYYDGGTRINAPLKPARKLGAERLVVIGLSSLSPGPRAIASEKRPDAFASVGMVVQGMAGDRMAQEVNTLAKVNKEVVEKRRSGRRPIPYIAIAPKKPATIERIALKIFQENYGGPLGLLRSPDIDLIGRLSGAESDVANATVLSMLLIDQSFIDKLIALGEADAKRWLEEPHDGPDGIWQLRPL